MQMAISFRRLAYGALAGNVVISTTMGDIEFRFREDVAPKHAAFMRNLIQKKARNPPIFPAFRRYLRHYFCRMMQVLPYASADIRWVRVLPRRARIRCSGALCIA